MFLLSRGDFFFMTFFVFFIGICGIVLMKESILLILISMELIFISMMLNIMFFSFQFNDIFGQIFVLVLLSMIAVESSISLAILVSYYSLTTSTNIDIIDFLKG